MDFFEIRCKKCNCSNLNISHKCIRCGIDLVSFRSSINPNSSGSPWDLVFNFLTQGDAMS